jgi:DNA-binding transcriptional LysR family regulator
MGVSLDVLRTFLAVYRAGSATRAAALLGLSQPTVTAQVKSLEADLGEPLFDRLPHGMAPTVAADALARQVTAPLDELDEVITAGQPAQPGRAVHLGGPAELTCSLVLPSLAPLIAGGLRLRVSLGLPDELAGALAGGGLDLMISTIRIRRRGLRAEPLCDEEFVLVAGASWTAGQLDRAPLVAYAENVPILRRYWRSVFGTRLTRAPALVVPDLRGVLAAVTAGAGVTVLPRYLCAGELADGRLRALGEPELAPINTLFLVSREGFQANPAARAVHAHLLLAGRTW